MNPCVVFVFIRASIDTHSGADRDRIFVFLAEFKIEARGAGYNFAKLVKKHL